MAKDPAFLFYSSDFLTGVIDMTMEERGQYITLMCLQHQKGHLPEKTITFCVGSVSESVLSKFSKDDKGNFFNKRLEIEIQKRESYTESRRKNGTKGGRPSKKAKDSNNCATLGKDSAGVAVPNHKGNENVDVNKDESAVDFYRNHVNPTASPISLQSISEFERQIGSDVCIRVMQQALDDKISKWSYIRTILENCVTEGVRCLADYQAREDQFRKNKKGSPKRNEKVETSDASMAHYIRELHREKGGKHGD